jgi:hypothetical protein
MCVHQTIGTSGQTGPGWVIARILDVQEWVEERDRLGKEAIAQDLGKVEIVRDLAMEILGHPTPVGAILDHQPPSHRARGRQRLRLVDLAVTETRARRRSLVHSHNLVRNRNRNRSLGHSRSLSLGQRPGPLPRAGLSNRQVGGQAATLLDRSQLPEGPSLPREESPDKLLPS